MRRLITVILFVFGAVVGGHILGYQASTVPESTAENSSTFETFATLPLTNTENIFETSDGSIYITGMDAHAVVKVTGDRRVEQFANVASSGWVFGIVGSDDGGFVLTASERPYFHRVGQDRIFDFSDMGAQVVLLDKAGNVTATIAAAKGAFFNGIAAAGNGIFLIADSANGIVQFDLRTKQLHPWLADEAFAPTDPVRVGANGIKVHDGWVYVSSRGAIYRVQIGADGGPKGALRVFAQGVQVDDFDVAKDGTLYLSSLTAVSPRGEVREFRKNVPTGPAVAVSREGRWLYWPTRGLEGQQKLLRTAIQ
jgi:hypothetical protein